MNSSVCLPLYRVVQKNLLPLKSLITHLVTRIKPKIGKIPMNKYGKMASKSDGSNIPIMYLMEKCPI